MENIYYGYIDHNGVLQESFFLPLSTVSLLLGVAGLIVSVLWIYFKRIKKNRL